MKFHLERLCSASAGAIGNWYDHHYALSRQQYVHNLESNQFARKETLTLYL